MLTPQGKPKAPDCTYNPTEPEKRAMEEDWERIQYMKDYRAKFEPQMFQAARAWNLLSEPVSDPNISNVLIPIARMIASTAIAAMTEGRPGFGFRPGAPSDFQKVPLWEAAVDQVLNESNFEAQQNLFVTDYTVLGCGVYDVYTQLPMRTVRYEQPDGTFTTEQKRDYRRPKVGVRARSPFEVWYWPNSRTHEEVPVTYDEESTNEACFERDYRQAHLPDGRKKFKNTEHVKAGYDLAFGNESGMMYREQTNDRITIGRLQDENGDVIRLYANKVLIFDKTLQIKMLGDTRCDGANVLGQTTLCFGPNNHQYDANLRTHALQWMGDPYMIRGLDAIYQAFGNMSIDNWRLANTNVISVEPVGLNPTPTSQLNARDFYSASFIDGKVVSTPLGQVNLSQYQFFQELLDNWCIWLTGTNFKQLVGETSKTAFELSQRIRAQNRRFEYKVRALESGCFLKMGRLILANVMSELTVEDYEDLTEKDLTEVREKFKNGEVPGDDYENLAAPKDSGLKPRRKVRSTIRVKGKVYREKFKKGEKNKRKFEPLADDNTLSLDLKAKGDSTVPAVPEYIWSQSYIEKKAIPDVFCEGKHMLGDVQDLQFAKIAALSTYARTRAQEAAMNPALKTNFDLEKIDVEYVRGAGVKEEQVMQQTDDSGGKADQIIKQIEDLISQPDPLPTSPNGQPTAPQAAPGAPAPNPALSGRPQPITPAPGMPESPLQGAAGGAS